MGLKESGLRGSLRNVSVGIDAIPDDEIDQFENYQPNGSDELSDFYSNDVSAFSIGESGFEGGQNLQTDDTSSSNNTIASFPGDGLPNYPAQGDLVWGRIRCDSTEMNLQFNVNYQDDDNRVFPLIRYRTGSIALISVSNGDVVAEDDTDFNASDFTGEYLFLKLSLNENNTYDVIVEDEGGNELASLSISDDSNVGNDGIAFRASQSGDQNANDGKWDEFVMLEGGADS